MSGSTVDQPDSTDMVAGDVLDVVLIGGGIMSATLGALLVKLQPGWSIAILERLNELAGESSNAENNAGTGHSGLCELNYMPDPADSTKAEDIARQFHQSRQFWASLVCDGDLPDPSRFINPTPHMDIVFGDRNIAYLKHRYATLKHVPFFSAMQFTEDPEVIRQWAPLLMDGRAGAEPMAATRYEAGTDIDFGALTHALVSVMRSRGAQMYLRHEATSLARSSDGIWTVEGRNLAARKNFRIRSRFVFVGAGGYALKLLQKSKIPQVRGYAVFPIGAQFFRTDNPRVVGRHDAKVYSQAAQGAPPMSVPHLDKRIVDGRASLMFGPYATFSTRLLKSGSLRDLFTTVKPHNITVLLAVGLQNHRLVRYLIGQLLTTRKRKFKQLQHFYPSADPSDWHLTQAGQRAQLVKPHTRKIGVLTFGTELVTGAEGTISGLLGASPGASVAPAVMFELLATCFPDEYKHWQETLRILIPDIGEASRIDQFTVDSNLEHTAKALRLR